VLKDKELCGLLSNEGPIEAGYREATSVSDRPSPGGCAATLSRWARG